MALTSKLGTSDSLLGNIQLAGGATVANTQLASSNLNLTQTVTMIKVLNISVTNTLVLTDTERAFQSKKIVSNTANFSQVVAPHYVFKRASTSNVTFVGVVLAERVHPAKNTIVFAGVATYEKFKGTNNTFAVTQSLSYSQIHSELPLTQLNLSQTVIVSAIRTFSTTHAIIFGHNVVVKRVRSFTVTNAFPISQQVSFVTILNPISHLALSHTLVYNKIMNLAPTSVVNFQQTVKVNFIMNRSVNDSLSFLHSHTRPSGTPGQRIAVPDVMITKVQRHVIYQTTTRALSLMPPEFGDGEAGTSTIVTLRTVTGLVFTYARRAIARKLTYKFLIGRPKAEETRSFIRDSLSTPMYMTNWKGELWYGYIVNNPFGMSPMRRRVPCDDEEIEIAVEFEGVRVH